MTSRALGLRAIPAATMESGTSFAFIGMVVQVIVIGMVGSIRIVDRVGIGHSVPTPRVVLANTVHLAKTALIVLWARTPHMEVMW